MNFDKKYNDLGKLTYEEDGFTYKFKDGIQKIKWTDIERIVAYKADLMTFDK